MPCVVLDRDGVINEDSDDYICSLDQWHPIPGSIAAIAELSQAGFTIVIATNQSGLGRGLFSLDDLEAIHDSLCQLVEEQGGAISGIFYCPHLPSDDCDCRKPKPGLLLAAERELGVSLKGATFIGDSLKDLQAARALGCQPVLVRTGKGATTAESLLSGSRAGQAQPEVPVYDDLAAAARHILSKPPVPIGDR